jgi:hypothetical protein
LVNGYAARHRQEFAEPALWARGRLAARHVKQLPRDVEPGGVPDDKAQLGVVIHCGAHPLEPVGEPGRAPIRSCHAALKELIYVFFFFSTRLGCMGSIAVSVILTVILLAVFHVL